MLEPERWFRSTSQQKLEHPETANNSPGLSYLLPWLLSAACRLGVLYMILRKGDLSPVPRAGHSDWSRRGSVAAFKDLTVQ